MVKDFIVTQWQKKQLPEEIQVKELAGVLNECERRQKEALEKMKHAEEKMKQEKNKKMEDRCKQMMELKLREDEVCGPCRSCFCDKAILQIHKYPVLVASAEGGGEGSVHQAEAAGEARQGKETAGREKKEFGHAVRESNFITSRAG